MRYSRPSAPLPRLDCTDAALEFSFMCNLEMVTKLCGPAIGEIVRNGKPSIILLVLEGIMVMVYSDQ